MKRSFVRELLKHFELFANRLTSGSAAVRPARTGADRSGTPGQLALTGLALAFLIVALTGCNQQPPARQALPPASVTVSKPVRKEIVDWNEFTGRTAAVNLVNITARVSGYIVNIPFKEGDMIHKGDLLYQIDPRPYQDVYDQALGQLKQAQANQQLQEVTYERQARLQQTKVIAKEDYDTALSNKNQAAAQVISAQAAVNAAQLNLEFTRVISPIDGRVGRQLVNLGNLVQADSTQLTTVVSIDPIYAYFSMDELAALGYQRLVRDGKLASTSDGKALVYLRLQDENGFPHEGTVNFADNAYDTTTGTLLIRATFQNHDGFLTPGNFVRVRIASSPQYEALLVADRAIGTDQDQSFVYVIDSKNIAQLRHVTVGPMADGLRVVKSGLKPDDVIVVNGILKVRPNSPVKPENGSMEQFATNDGNLPTKFSKGNASIGAVDGKTASR
jgi:membrane fusion protein, multidrug efflux system